jgi:hypothetical protein
MLKYLYSKANHKSLFLKVTEQKIINEVYLNKFFVRSSIIETQEILILDNNYNFFLINKNNIQNYLSFFKGNNLLGKSLQLKEFIYSKKHYFKIKFYIGNVVYNNYLSYLNLLYILKRTIKININYIWPLLIVNKGSFIYIFNGLKGVLPRKSFIKLRKILKKLRRFLSLKQKFLILLKKYKNLIFKSLLLKNLKLNKLFIIKHKYKNQIKNTNSFLKQASILKNKKLFIKNKK